jgi:hypothetical protein
LLAFTRPSLAFAVHFSRVVASLRDAFLPCVRRPTHIVARRLSVDESSCSPYAEISLATRTTEWSGREWRRRREGKTVDGNGFSFGWRGTGTLTEASVAAHSDADNSPAGPAVPFSFFFPPAAAAATATPAFSRPICPGRATLFASLDVSRSPPCTTAPARRLLFSSIFRFFRAGRTPAAGTRRATSSRL